MAGLSKTQWLVLDRLAAGWKLAQRFFHIDYYWEEQSNVAFRTVESLKRAGLIEKAADNQRFVEITDPGYLALLTDPRSK